MIKFSYFTNKLSTCPENMEVYLWGQFVEFLKELSKFKFSTKNEAPLISPAVYPIGRTRKNENVESVSFIMLDVDNGQAFHPNRVADKFAAVPYLLYTTASATRENPRYRLCLETTRSMTPQEAKIVWRHCVGLIEGVADKACCDPSRAYWVPAQYHGATNWLNYSDGGCPIDVDEVTKPNIPFPMEQASAFKPLPQRLMAMPIKKPNWTSAFSCPLINPQKINDYVNLPRGQGSHYAAMFGMMRSIVVRADLMGYEIDAMDIARLAEEIDGIAGGTWKTKGYDFLKHAKNAIMKQ